MSHQLALFYSAEDGQQSIDWSELSGDTRLIPWRDHNVNNGPGMLTVNNMVIQQVQSTYRHIRGTEEEEAEYGEASRGVVLFC
ncbi:hypothetical protein PM082_006166 [Marasmius tenuissimus]|nr:hypothetical protein PM082_006166 [Marasmius tenuissimus]